MTDWPGLNMIYGPLYCTVTVLAISTYSEGHWEGNTDYTEPNCFSYLLSMQHTCCLIMRSDTTHQGEAEWEGEEVKEGAEAFF